MKTETKPSFEELVQSFGLWYQTMMILFCEDPIVEFLYSNNDDLSLSRSHKPPMPLVCSIQRWPNTRRQAEKRCSALSVILAAPHNIGKDFTARRGIQEHDLAVKDFDSEKLEELNGAYANEVALKLANEAAELDDALMGFSAFDTARGILNLSNKLLLDLTMHSMIPTTPLVRINYGHDRVESFSILVDHVRA